MSYASKGRSNRLRTIGLRLLSNCDGRSNSAVRNTVVPRQKNLKPRNCGRRRRLNRPHLTPAATRGSPLPHFSLVVPPLLGSRKPRPPGRRAGLEALPIITRGEFRSSAPKQIRERGRWFPMFGHKGKPRRSGAKCTGLCGRRGIGSSATGQFRARGSVPSARTLATGGRHRHPTYDHLRFSPIEIRPPRRSEGGLVLKKSTPPAIDLQEYFRFHSG